jgi:hypothetical protein
MLLTFLKKIIIKIKKKIVGWLYPPPLPFWGWFRPPKPIEVARAPPNGKKGVAWPTQMTKLEVVNHPMVHWSGSATPILARLGCLGHPMAKGGDQLALKSNKGEAMATPFFSCYFLLFV